MDTTTHASESVTPELTPQELSDLNGGYVYEADEYVPRTSDNKVGELPQAAADLLHTSPDVRDRFGSILATAGGATALAFLLAACGPIAEPAPTPSVDISSPTAEPIDTPSPEESPTASPEQDFTIESLLIPGDLTPEATSTLLTQDRITAWAMAGTTPENAEKYLTVGDTEKFIQTIAAMNAQVAADALLIPDWDNGEHKDLEAFVAQQTSINVETLLAYFKSASGLNPDDIFPYSRTEVVKDDGNTVLSTTDNGFVVATHGTTVLELRNRITDTNTVDGSTFTFTNTFQIVDDNARLSAWNTRPGN